MFGSGIHVAVSKRCNFSGIGLCLGRAYTWRCRKGVNFRPWVVVGPGLHVAVSKRVIFRHQVVFGSGLHVAVSKSCNFQALGCVLVGLTHCGVEKL